VVDATHALATARLARLAAYYAYDVALAGMLAACGLMDDFHKYASEQL
jgi:outer membrane protein TolC